MGGELRVNPSINRGNLCLSANLFATQLSPQVLAATWNHFNRAFLRDEFIPLLKIVIAVAKSPLAVPDTGGACLGAPADCPDLPPSYSGDTCTPHYHVVCCDGRNVTCEIRARNVISCPNPVFGNDSALNATASQVQRNISLWDDSIASLLKQVRALLPCLLMNYIVVAPGNKNNIT